LLNALLSNTIVKLVLLVNPSASCSRTSNQHDTFLLQRLDLKSKSFLAPRSFSHQKNSAVWVCDPTSSCFQGHATLPNDVESSLQAANQRQTQQKRRHSTFGAVQDLQPSSPCVIHVVPDT
jgi:hypothetical protein